MKKNINTAIFRLTRYTIRKHNEFLKWFYSEKLLRSINVIGENVKINGKIEVLYPKGLLLGNNVHIGKGAHIDARAGVVIGDNTHISRNLTLYSTNHNYEGELIPYDETLIPGSVIIEENVWIGMNVCVTPGVTIGRGAIIGMGSIVSKDVKKGEIVVSGSQRVIGNRDFKVFDKKNADKLFGGVNGKKLNSDQIINYKKTLIHTSNKGDNIVFVLSTGRAGSNALAEIMRQNNNIVSYHEPLYVLLKTLCTRYICGKINREEAKQEIIKFYSNISLVNEGKIYLESDQKLVPFIDILLEIFPKAKFIWLIRDPYKFAISATSRGWFAQKDKIIFFKESPILDRRISSEGQRNFLDFLDEYQTENLTPFEKNVLYWKVWNNLIYKEYLNICTENKLFLRLEDLDNKINEIQIFLNQDQNFEKIKSKKTNKVKARDKRKYAKNKKRMQEFIDSCRIEVKEELKLWSNL